jgi:hypothetical protein
MLLATVVVAVCLAMAPKDRMVEGLAFGGCLAAFVIGMFCTATAASRPGRTLAAGLLWLVSLLMGIVYVTLLWMRTR